MSLLDPFSDPDVDRAWRLLNEVPGLTERDKEDFIDGFFYGWKAVKEIDDQQFIRDVGYELVSKGKLLKIQNDNLKNNPRELPKSMYGFGRVLGTIIGFLRLQPLSILTLTPYYSALFKFWRRNRIGSKFYDGYIAELLIEAKPIVIRKIDENKFGERYKVEWIAFLKEFGI